MINLIVVGVIGLDDIKTPFGEVHGVLGGCGSYSSVAASFFTRAGLVSIAGDDLPKAFTKIFEQRHIDLQGLVTKGKTFRWTGLYEYDLSEAKTLETKLNSLADFQPEMPHQYRRSKYLLLGNTDPDHQLKALSQMENKPFVVLDTMNYWISNKKDQLLKIISKVDLVVVNEGEARQLFGTSNLIKAGRMLLDLGPQYAVIKKGEHGAMLFGQDIFFSAPGYPLEEVKDPTGAGDSFAGGLIGYLAKTDDTSEKNIRKAIVYGSVLASFCAEDFSLNYLQKVGLKEVEERYRVFKQIKEF